MIGIWNNEVPHFYFEVAWFYKGHWVPTFAPNNTKLVDAWIKLTGNFIYLSSFSFTIFKDRQLKIFINKMD